MDAGDEMPALAQEFPYLFGHSRHYVHADHYIGRVGQLDTDMRDVRAERPHGERNHIQGSTAHASVEKLVQSCAHVPGMDPVVCRTCIFLLLRADEGSVFGPSHIIGIREGKKTVWAKLWIQRFQHPRLD